ISSVRLPIAYVFADRSGKQEVGLRNHADCLSERSLSQISNVDAVHQDAAFKRIVESGNEINQAGLAGAVPSYKSDGFARAANQVDGIQCYFPRLISETDIPKFDCSVDSRPGKWPYWVLDLRFDRE